MSRLRRWFGSWHVFELDVGGEAYNARTRLREANVMTLRGMVRVCWRLRAMGETTASNYIHRSMAAVGSQMYHDAANVVLDRKLR